MSFWDNLASLQRGGRLTMDLKTGPSTVDGAGGPGPGTSSHGGRVSGTFAVPEQKQP